MLALISHHHQWHNNYGAALGAILVLCVIAALLGGRRNK